MSEMDGWIDDILEMCSLKQYTLHCNTNLSQFFWNGLDVYNLDVCNVDFNYFMNRYLDGWVS